MAISILSTAAQAFTHEALLAFLTERLSVPDPSPVVPLAEPPLSGLCVSTSSTPLVVGVPLPLSTSLLMLIPVAFLAKAVNVASTNLAVKLLSASVNIILLGDLLPAAAKSEMDWV